MNRFYVQSEQVRYERRVYWVQDRERTSRARHGGLAHARVTRDTTSKATAERWAQKLNEENKRKGEQCREN